MGVGGPTLMRGFGAENRSYGGHRRWCLDERHSVNQRTARIGGDQAEGGPHRRGLPGAVRPKETGHLAVFGGETGIIKHGLTPEAFGKASIVIMIRAYTPASPVLRNPAMHDHCGCGAGVDGPHGTELRDVYHVISEFESFVRQSGAFRAKQH